MVIFLTNTYFITKHRHRPTEAAFLLIAKTWFQVFSNDSGVVVECVGWGWFSDVGWHGGVLWDCGVGWWSGV